MEMWNKIMKEVQLGRYAGPFKRMPYKYFVQLPIGLVPKKGNKTRLIFHLSYDFNDNEKSINACTPEKMCHIKYNDLDHAVQACLCLMEHFRQQNLKIFYAKSNIMSTFRIVPILLGQCFLLCMYTIHPLTNEV